MQYTGVLTSTILFCKACFGTGVAQVLGRIPTYRTGEQSRHNKNWIERYSRFRQSLRHQDRTVLKRASFMVHHPRDGSEPSSNKTQIMHIRE